MDLVPLVPDWMRSSTRRSDAEASVFSDPPSQLSRMRRLVSSWRERELSVVFGNLGRQPYLLTYYLDLCFGYEDTIRIVCDWHVSYDYQKEEEGVEPIDFLIYVEPHFGFTLYRPSNAKHVICLSSHLNLPYWGDERHIQYYFLHLSSVVTSRDPDPALRDCEVFVPPPFHEPESERPGSRAAAILLDVSGATCAREAYLKLLTGREMIGDRAFRILLQERHRVLLRHPVRQILEEATARSEQGRWRMCVDTLNGDTASLVLYAHLGLEPPPREVEEECVTA